MHCHVTQDVITNVATEQSGLYYDRRNARSLQVLVHNWKYKVFPNPPSRPAILQSSHTRVTTIMQIKKVFEALNSIFLAVSGSGDVEEPSAGRQ